ncbi:MAG: hypothetical protein ABI662_09580 [Dermatophilaceae bacterium]
MRTHGVVVEECLGWPVRRPPRRAGGTGSARCALGSLQLYDVVADTFEQPALEDVDI